MLVNDAGGEQNAGGLNSTMRVLNAESRPRLQQGCHFGLDRHQPVVRRLRCERGQEPLPGNPIRKARVIVAFGDETRAAPPGVEHSYSSMVARQIDGSRKARRAAAYDQAIDMLFSHLVIRLSGVRRQTAGQHSKSLPA
jgi:hypothetical protein